MPAAAFKDAVYPLALQALDALEHVAQAPEPSSLEARERMVGRAEVELLRALRSVLSFCAAPALTSQWPEETELHRTRTAQLMGSVERHIDTWEKMALPIFWPAYRLSVRRLLEAVYDYLLLQDFFCTCLMNESLTPGSPLGEER
ncbi:hypothetical protein [Sphingomonas sp. R1]|uniref:hypothetical protein n=1 Tax=Sphingomonas sp. R1 TaxID=399176 RepID=UPI0022257475|nr:hypothetical protein [Sphingomonas sp. R1]UYY76864.1 hypothetical protein OIM94_15350 [Sphingomonas sp. R1]